MFSLSRLAKVGYLLAFAVVVFLLVSPNLSQAQFGVAGGFRGTPALPTIAIPIISGSGSASGSGSGAFGVGGGSGSSSGSFTTTIVQFNLGALFNNGGRILTLPPPTLMPQLNNLLFADFLFSPFTSDTTGAPWAALLGLGAGGGLGISGMVGGIGGIAGGGGGIAGTGGGAGGFGGQIGGGFAGVGGGIGGQIGGFGQGGGMGGFAGKGMGGFNGKKAL